MVKNFFDYYPEQIFSPLTGPSRRMYLNLIMSIYKQFFDESSDLDDVTLPATQVRSHILSFLIMESVWVDEDSGEEQVIYKEQDNKDRVYNIYSRLVTTGWLRVENRGHKDYIFMTPRIIELIEFLGSAGRNLSKFVGGNVLSVYQGLKGIVEGSKDTVITYAIDKAMVDSVEMGKRMNSLAMHLREITEKIGEYSDTSKKADTFFNGFINQSSFADYNNIKKADHPLRFKSDILRFVDDIEYNPNTRSRVLSAIKQDDLYVRPEEALAKYLRTIRRVFINTDNLLDKVDKTHAKLAIRFNESIRYRRRAGTNIRALIETTFLKFNVHDDPESIDIPTNSPDISGIYQDFIFTVRRKVSPIEKDEGTEVRTVSSFTRVKNDLHRQYLNSMKVTDSKLQHWLSRVLNNQQQIDSLSIQVETPEDFAMFIQSLRLCHERQYFQGKFNKTLLKYSFITISDEPVEHEAFYCSVFRVTRRA